GTFQSWVAFQGRPAASVRAELRLRAAAAGEGSQSPYLGATLPDGWHLLIVGRSQRFVDPALLATLSRGCEAIACFIEDHVMVSQASGWADGRCLWKVDHDSQAVDQLQVTGEPPALFGPIREDLEAKQRASDADAEANSDFLVDYLF